MKAHWLYLKSVCRHKWFVFLACLQTGVPIWSAILHDWDKFLPDEWFPYVQTSYAPDGSKQYKESPAFARAWNLHQKRNKHHWQYWLLTWDRGVTEALPMPDLARREMLADWIGAGRAYVKDWTPLEPRKWYQANREKMSLHPETREWIEWQLIGLPACRDAGIL